MDRATRRLEDLITVVIAAHPGISKTALVKILYFVDIRSCENRATPLSPIQWYWHWFGPYSNSITDVLTDMEINGEIEVRPRPNPYGHPEYRLYVTEHAGLFGELSNEEEDLVRATAGEFGRYPPSVLAKLSYQTAPMQSVQQRGEKLRINAGSGDESPPRFVPDPTAPPSPKMDASWSGG